MRKKQKYQEINETVNYDRYFQENIAAMLE